MCEWSGGAHSKAEVNGEGLGGAGRVRWEGWGWSRDHAAGHHACHHCHQPSSKSGLGPAPARFEAGPRGPSPIGPKLGEGRPLGSPSGPAKSGADRGGPGPRPGSSAPARAARGIDIRRWLNNGTMLRASACPSRLLVV